MIEEVIEFKDTYGYLDKEKMTYYYNAKSALLELGYKTEEGEPDRERANTILRKSDIDEITDEQFESFIPESYAYALAIYGTNEKSDDFRKMVISTLLPHMRKSIGWLETLPSTLKDQNEKLDTCTRILNAIGTAIADWQKVYYKKNDENNDVFKTSNSSNPSDPLITKMDI